MGGKQSKLPIITESAKEVLSRRSSVPPRGVIGPTRPPKPILENYNEESHNEMTKILNIKTTVLSVSFFPFFSFFLLLALSFTLTRSITRQKK